MEKQVKKEPVATERGGELQRPAASHPLSILDEMDRMMDRLFRGSFLRPWRWEPRWSEMAQPFEARLPSVDIIDRDNEVLVRAELPGVDKKDLDVSVTENTVTIKGSTQREEKEEKGDYYRCERSRGEFARTLALPASVDGTKSKADFHDGMLELRLPKIEAAQRRKIPVT